MQFEYDIAISFAGENRNTAEDIAGKLKANGVRVFYDKYEEAHLLGMDLYEHLHDVYSNKAKCCMMLISQYYVDKAWTTHERKSVQERALLESGPYIIPVRLDDTPVPGLRSTVAYFDLRTRSVDALIDLMLQKLGKEQGSKTQQQDFFHSPSYNIPLPKIKKRFSERDKDKFYEDCFITIKAYFKQGIKKLNETEGYEADFMDMSAYRFSCKIYSDGKRVAACTVWMGNSHFSGNSIGFSYEPNQELSNSLNESLSIQETGDALKLKAMMDIFGLAKSQLLSPSEAAEYLWKKLIERLNQRY